MSYSAASAKPRLLAGLLTVIFASALVVWGAADIFAANTAVNVSVCGVGSGATVAIASPQSDTVVDQPVVQLSGTVSNATQIDVSVDGHYDSTLPLSASQTSYQTPVQLTSGTHTISLVANDVCQVQDGTASVVVTYQAQSTPGTGQGTPTQVGEGGVQLGEPLSASDGQDKSGPGIEDMPIIGPLAKLAQNLAIALDFEVKPQSGMLMQSVVRFSFIVVGIAATAVGTVATAMWGLFFGPMTVPQRWMLRFGGIGLIVLAFLI